MSLDAVEAPDLIEPLIGYRYWRLQDDALCSPFVAFRWERGMNTARCAVDPGHLDPPPAHDCACGIHAWYRPCPRLGYATPDLIGGAVALWGAIELHPTGMRAQHAAVVALALPLAHTAKRRRVLGVAASLEVETAPARQLMHVAAQHGCAVTPALVPVAS
jgi:hypothetical protein